MLQTIAISTLFLVFILGLLLTNASKSFAKSFSSNASNYLTSIGIFFTFLGIFLALRQFDVNNINTAVPKLLDGLKLAFLSSVTGIGGSILYRVVRPLAIRSSISENVSGSDLLEQLVNLNQGTNAVKDALVGEGDSSLSTQMMKLRTDFRDFAEKVTEDGSNALIKALEEVMRDFNAKINEQFGENFKQLNEAVSALLEWQKEHKKQVEALTEIFTEAQKGIDTVKTHIQEIENSTSKIPEQIAKIEDVFDATDKRMSELHEGLGSLSAMREKAEDALPHIENQLKSMTDGLRDSIGKQMDYVSEIFEYQTEQSAKTQEKFTGVLDSLNLAADDLQTTAKDTSQQVKDIISDFKKQQGDLSRDLQSTLQESVNDIEKTLNQSVSSLDNSMQQTLQRSLDMLANNLTAITKRFVDTYEPFAERVNNIMRGTGRND